MTATLKLTNNAIAHFKTTLQESPDATGIRIGVKTMGCSGHTYTIDFIKEISDSDYQIKQGGIHFVIDKQTYDTYLQGCEIDFIKKGFSQTVEFKNPNAESSCGCGESFLLKSEIKK